MRCWIYSALWINSSCGQLKSLSAIAFSILLNADFECLSVHAISFTLISILLHLTFAVFTLTGSNRFYFWESLWEFTMTWNSCTRRNREGPVSFCPLYDTVNGFCLMKSFVLSLLVLSKDVRSSMCCFASENWRLDIELSWGSWNLLQLTCPVEQKLQLASHFKLNNEHFPLFNVKFELDTTIYNFGMLHFVQKHLVMHQLVFIDVICILRGRVSLVWIGCHIESMLWVFAWNTKLDVCFFEWVYLESLLWEMERD